MIKHKWEGFIEQTNQGEGNEFMFVQKTLQLDSPKTKGRLSIKTNFEKEKAGNELRFFPKHPNPKSKLKLKTQSNDMLRLRKLPDLVMRTPLGNMRHSQLEKSKKIIRSSYKNTEILNELIGILQDGSQIHPQVNKIKMKPAPLKEKSGDYREKNQFLEEKAPKVFQPSRPKIIQTEIMKVYEDGPIKRNIYSEDRARPVPKKYSYKKKNIRNQSVELLTFYNVKQRANTESVNQQRKGIICNSQIVP